MPDTAHTFGQASAPALLNILEFLMNSSAHSIETVSVDLLSPAVVSTLRAALQQDGYDADVIRRATFTALTMVSGRVERSVISAFISGDLAHESSAQYFVEADSVVGRRYPPARAGFTLNHEIRTFDEAPVFVSGNVGALGMWDPQRALPLAPTGAGRGGRHWAVSLEVERARLLEFKFLKRPVLWESGPNRRFAADGDLTTSDMFRE